MDIIIWDLIMYLLYLLHPILSLILTILYNAYNSILVHLYIEHTPITLVYMYILLYEVSVNQMSWSFWKQSCNISQMDLFMHPSSAIAFHKHLMALDIQPMDGINISCLHHKIDGCWETSMAKVCSWHCSWSTSVADSSCLWHLGCCIMTTNEGYMIRSFHKLVLLTLEVRSYLN